MSTQLTTLHYQTRLFEKLKTLGDSKIKFSEQVASILNISESGAARRIKGEVGLLIDEAVLLCQQFNSPLTWITEPTPDYSIFRWHEVNSMASFQLYLNMMLRTMERMIAAQKAEMIYSALDAPLFHHFGSELLTRFKIHFWLETIVGSKTLKGKFQPQLIPDECIVTAKNIYEYWLRVPSKEIWCHFILNTTLSQVQYYWDSGYFKSASTAHELLDELNTIIDHIESMCETGTKCDIADKHNTPYAAYNLYVSDMFPGAHTVLTCVDNVKTIYNSHHTFQSMVITDERYCAATENWMNHIIGTTTPISLAAVKERTKFFTQLRGSVDAVKAAII